MGDTGHLTLVPAYVEPSKRVPESAYRTVRWICFLTFLASMLFGVASRHPGGSDFSHFVSDVQHGQVSKVSVEALDTGDPHLAVPVMSEVRVRWRTGLFSWQQADVHSDLGRTAGTRIEQALAGAAPISIETYWPHRNRSLGFASNLDLGSTGRPEPFTVAAGALLLATFLGMLFTREHQYANRWAWFWLFVVGGVGPLLILWKEPMPLRLQFWKRDTEPYRWTQTPMTGGIGLLMAVGWTIILTVAGFAVSWLASI